MKKLLLNILMGIIISIAAMGITTLWLGAMYTNNGFLDLVIDDLFSNVGIKFILACLGGIIVGIFNYIGSKYKKNVLLNIGIAFLIAIIAFLILNFTNYSLLFKVLYFAVLGLAICTEVTISELLISKSDEKSK